VAVEGAALRFEEVVDGFDAAGDVVEENVLLALEGVVAGDELLDSAGEAVQGDGGFALGGDEARSVAVGEEIEEAEKQKQDDELRAPGNDDALEEELGELGALVEEEPEESEKAAGTCEGGSQVAGRGLGINGGLKGIVHGRKGISHLRFEI
jgi:hypothetical protein